MLTVRFHFNMYEAIQRGENTILSFWDVEILGDTLRELSQEERDMLADLATMVYEGHAFVDTERFYITRALNLNRNGEAKNIMMDAFPIHAAPPLNKDNTNEQEVALKLLREILQWAIQYKKKAEIFS